jgi:hypothetical protein
MWRVERATFASAVLVIRRRSDDRVLALSSASGSPRLPRLNLDAWIPIQDQVEQWQSQLIADGARPSLVAVAGSPGPGVIFLYGIETDADELPGMPAIWLSPEDICRLDAAEEELLALCAQGRATSV